MDLFQCNLAPPDGIRGCNGDDSDEIEESEEADRIRYKETLGKDSFVRIIRARAWVGGNQPI